MAASPQSLAELIVRVDQGEKFRYLYFWGHTQKGDGLDASCFSQWFPTPFTDNGYRFPTAEHYMMFRKALLFDDPQIADKVLKAGNPGKAKSLGRKVSGFNESLWLEHRSEIVESASYLKFSQNADLGEFLCGTAARILVEASPVDRIRGIGLSKDQASQLQPRDWKGLNLLGFALMAARDKLLSS